MSDPQCYYCKSSLVVDVNWYPRYHSLGRRICITCESDRKKRWYQRNKEKVNQRATRWYNASGRLLRYGLSEYDYKQMLTAQEGRCAICLRSPAQIDSARPSLVIDHDHETGRIRGLLCNTCNRGLGMFYDSLPRVQAAFQYLQKFNNEG